ncbi:MAG: hybrid sensor histidine kinase/response regulator [Calditrichaeota bacterium]|nr:MAG: response regulator [Calditrichota bacterium]MBL1206232.1 hybrid sensor histidine kinase/response regulator [Calditrichota bacterium]NOG46058.1 response regulator [Calditrichota bacterium]
MEKLSVLIVDDEYGMRRGAQKALKKYKVIIEEPFAEVGFEIDQAENGSEALEKLSTKHFDLLLLDYKMPDMTGLEVLNYVQEQKIDVLTVMVTAYASLEVAVSATKNGAFDFLAKPFSPDELRSVVGKAVNNLISKRQARKLAAEKKRVRFQFITVLAHELKAPLAAVESYMQLLKQQTLGDELINYDKVISRSITRIEGMRKMILDLLDLTRIESGQKKRILQDINIGPIAKTSIEMIQLVAEERGISINLDVPKKLNIQGDPDELLIIFNNLISNAVKYNRENGQVNVKIIPGEEQVTICVSDTGIGMTAEERETLFGEFVRIKNEDTRAIIGSGLGLSILKKLVSLYNGKISIESEKGKGSTFTVILKNKQVAQSDQEEGSNAA